MFRNFLKLLLLLLQQNKISKIRLTWEQCWRELTHFPFFYGTDKKFSIVKKSRDPSTSIDIKNNAHPPLDCLSFYTTKKLFEN